MIKTEVLFFASNYDDDDDDDADSMHVHQFIDHFPDEPLLAGCCCERESELLGVTCTGFAEDVKVQ